MPEIQSESGLFPVCPSPEASLSHITFYFEALLVLLSNLLHRGVFGPNIFEIGTNNKKVFRKKQKKNNKQLGSHTNIWYVVARYTTFLPFMYHVFHIWVLTRVKIMITIMRNKLSIMYTWAHVIRTPIIRIIHVNRTDFFWSHQSSW